MSKTIIIIGAGLAGLSAALQSAENGCNVKLVSSFPSERAQSVMAEGGINAALNTKDENDSPEEHFTDTMLNRKLNTSKNKIKLQNKIINRWNIMPL